MIGSDWPHTPTEYCRLKISWNEAKWRATYGSVAQGLPREVQVLDRRWNGNDEVEGVLVDDTFADVEQLCRQSYNITGQKERKKKKKNMDKYKKLKNLVTYWRLD